MLALGACAAPRLPGGKVPSVGRFGRPPGMPIGAAAGKESAAWQLPSELAEGRELEEFATLDIPVFEQRAAEREAAPCSGCAELRVYLNDINQRDEFELAAPGPRITRVVWTLRAVFNSDQLAVQSFVDEQRGEYTKLHVSAFPLGQPIEVSQTVRGRAKRIGLMVGSSGAWTGDQVIQVFVDSLRAEGADGFVREFDGSLEGLAPRTHTRDPTIVLHPAEPGAPAARPPEAVPPS